MTLTPILRIFSALLSVLAALNLLVLILAEPIQRYFPVNLTPAGGYMDAIVAFGVGAGVYLLSEMARPKKGH